MVLARTASMWIETITTGQEFPSPVFRTFWYNKCNTMSNANTRRIQRPATPEELEKLEKYQQQVAQDVPDLRRQAIDAEAEMRQAMMREPTVSGQLRSAVAESGIDHRELAAQAGLSPKTLAEFLVGKASLDSEVIDKLAAVLKHELKPIG